MINFFPNLSTGAIVWLSLWIGIFALFCGGLCGTLNESSWKRWQRRREAEKQAAKADPAARFCCSCRHARWHDKSYSADWKCAHPSSMRSRGQYLANGEHSLDNMYDCSVVRESRGEAQCGPEGRHWAGVISNGVPGPSGAIHRG